MQAARCLQSMIERLRPKRTGMLWRKRKQKHGLARWKKQQQRL